MGLADAREAMGQASSANEPNESGNQEPSGDQGNQQTPSEIVDLDALEKVRYQGKELTREELQNAFLFQSDYTRKTQALAEERKFTENFSHDVANVMRNPNLISEFKKIYPEKYHQALDQILSNNPQARQQALQTPQKAEIDPAIMKRLENIEGVFKEREIEAIEAQLDVTFQKYSKKYNLADEESVISRAQAVLDKKDPLYLDREGKISEQGWEKIWKSIQDRNQKMFEGHYKGLIDKQKQVGVGARDTAAGGGIPGQAPKKMTMREATEQAVRDLTSRPN